MEKLYYSIKEVAALFGVNYSYLRFLEKEFEQLRPHRNDKGTRFYTRENIATIKQIIFLVKEQGLTLDGARKRLGSRKDHVAKQQEIAERLRAVRKELKGISRFLQEE